MHFRGCQSFFRCPSGPNPLHFGDLVVRSVRWKRRRRSPRCLGRFEEPWPEKQIVRDNRLLASWVRRFSPRMLDVSRPSIPPRLADMPESSFPSPPGMPPGRDPALHSEAYFRRIAATAERPAPPWIRTRRPRRIPLTRPSCRGRRSKRRGCVLDGSLTMPSPSSASGTSRGEALLRRICIFNNIALGAALPSRPADSSGS